MVPNPFSDETRVRPDGLTIRRRRRARGWSRADLVGAIETRSLQATGRSESVSRNVLQGVEEANERVPYATLCLISLGLDCNPVEILLSEVEDADTEPADFPHGRT